MESLLLPCSYPSDEQSIIAKNIIMPKLESKFSGRLKTGAVNCIVHRDLCVSLDIKPLPSLMLFVDGSTYKYNGQMNYDSMLTFVSGHMK